MMKKVIVSVLLAMFFILTNAQDLVKEINQAQFHELIGTMDNGMWQSQVSRTAVVDFNADWCGPCRKLAPILKELASEMTDIDFYSVNVDKNKELAKALRVSSIPMLLIVPAKGQPQAIVGLYPKEEIVNTINYVVNSALDEVKSKEE